MIYLSRFPKYKGLLGTPDQSRSIAQHDSRTFSQLEHVQEKSKKIGTVTSDDDRVREWTAYR